MSFLDRIRECQVFNPTRYLPLTIGGTAIGRIARGFVEHLRPYSDVLSVTDKAVTVNDALATYDARTAAFDAVVSDLNDRGLVSGWRGEAYPVGVTYSEPACFEMERAAVPLFGVRGYGVHINGYVEKADGLHLWVATRSPTKQTAPGKLDQVVAGGQPAGMTLAGNVIKECAEEANIPEALAEKARPVGTVTYTTERPEGLRHDVLFNFDLKLPESFQPENTDGEVECFELWPIERVAQVIEETDRFKFNAALVIIDFLVRHGLIDADHRDYTEIVGGLHGGTSADRADK